MQITDAILAAVFTGLGLLISKGIDLFKARRGETREDKKVDADIDKSETSQALEMYKGLIESLKSDIREMLTHLRQLEEDHLACREENAALRTELKALKERLASLEAELKEREAA